MTEMMVSSRKRRANAGSRLKQLIEQEELANQSVQSLAQIISEEDENVNLLFQEDENDDEFVDSDVDNANLKGIDEEEDEELEDEEEERGSGSDTLKRSLEEAQLDEDNDDVFSESEISASDSDESEGERELARQERARKKLLLLLRRGNRQAHVPAIKKAVPVPTKKPKTALVSSVSLLLADRRSSSRSAALENKQALVQRLKESEERRARFVPVIRHKEAELTQEEKLHEAIETERLNVLSLNQFREQEFVKKEHQRNALLSKRKILTNVIRFTSQKTFVTPTDEIDHARRAHILQGKMRKRPGRRKRLQPEQTTHQRFPGEVDAELPAVKLEMEQARLDQARQLAEPDHEEGNGSMPGPDGVVEKQDVQRTATNNASDSKDATKKVSYEISTEKNAAEKASDETVSTEEDATEKCSEEKVPEETVSADKGAKDSHSAEMAPSEKDDSEASSDLATKSEIHSSPKETNVADDKALSPAKELTTRTDSALNSADRTIQECDETETGNSHDKIVAGDILKEEKSDKEIVGPCENSRDTLPINEHIHETEMEIDSLPNKENTKLAPETPVDERPAPTVNDEPLIVVIKNEDGDAVPQPSREISPAPAREIPTPDTTTPVPATSVTTTDTAATTTPATITQVFEGPDQLVGRNSLHFINFDDEGRQLRLEASIKTIIFGPQSLLPALHRFKDVKTIVRISGTNNPYSTTTLATKDWLFELATDITDRDPEFDELKKLPRLGVTQDVVEEVEEDTKDELVPIVIHHEAPTGLYLPNGNKKPCLITGTEVKYFDPNNGIPYSSVETYRLLKKIEQGLVPWYSLIADQDDAGSSEFYLGALDGTTRHAKGVPEGFDG